MGLVRSDFSMTATPSGRVLVIAGSTTSSSADSTATTEWFDGGTWGAGPSLPVARAGAQVAITDGGVLTLYGGLPVNPNIQRLFLP